MIYAHLRLQVWWVVPSRFADIFEDMMATKYQVDRPTMVAWLRGKTFYPALTSDEFARCGMTHIVQKQGQMVITSPVRQITSVSLAIYCRCIYYCMYTAINE